MIFVSFLTVLILLSYCCNQLNASYSPIYDDGNSILNKGLNSNIFHHFGTFSSRFTVQPKGPLNPPENCEIVQVTSLERHGSRHLSNGAHKSALNSLNIIQNAINQSNHPTHQFPKELQFLKTASIDPIVEDLLPFGALQAWYSGLSTATVYEKLAKNGGVFIRSTGNDIPGQDRVLLTSKYWRLGFHGEKFPGGKLMKNSNDTRSLAKNIQPANVIFAENSITNDTLSPSTCPADSASKPVNISSDAQQALYANSTLLPTVGKRLEDYFKKYNIQFNITQSIITDLANLCLFETFSNVYVDEIPTIKQSQFCNLFDDQKDWQILGYYMNLGMYYQAGYGDPYHKALGTGFLRELLARLNNSLPPINPPTSLNTTLDIGNSPSTFPVKDGMIYMDTSHDGTMASIVSTIGLKRRPTKLKSTKHAELQPYNFKFAEIAPMQGKVVFEKLHCKQVNHKEKRWNKNHHHHHDHSKIKKYIRIRMNDSTQILHKHWCPNFTQYEKTNHICPLKSFMNNLEFVNSSNEWDKCYLKQ